MCENERRPLSHSISSNAFHVCRKQFLFFVLCKDFHLQHPWIILVKLKNMILGKRILWRHHAKLEKIIPPTKPNQHLGSYKLNLNTASLNKFYHLLWRFYLISFQVSLDVSKRSIIYILFMPVDHKMKQYLVVEAIGNSSSQIHKHELTFIQFSTVVGLKDQIWGSSRCVILNFMNVDWVV